MKNVLLAILLAMVFGLGWYALRTMRVSFHDEKGLFAKVIRSDLTIPINATGDVQYKSLTEIKSEASGTVEKRFFEAGDLVKKGELLIRLTRDEEQRGVDRAEADLQRAQANLDQARLTLRERKEIGVDRAQASLDGIIAQLDDAEHDWLRIQALDQRGEANPRELVAIKSRYDRLLAQKDDAQAQIRQAQLAIAMAEQDVILAQAALTTAEKNLSDAQERLDETEIFSPIDGMIIRMLVQEGEVIQAGKGALTVGTVLAFIADVSEIYVRAEVDEADFGVIREIAPPSARFGGNLFVERAEPPEAPIDKDASTVRVLVEAYRDEEFVGTIERIYPEPRKAASVVTYFVDILLTGENRDKLAMGMQADVEFTAQSVHDALLVRHDAIHKEADKLGVYRPTKAEGQRDPAPRFVPCRFGLDNGLYAELLEGDVKEGDEVYTKLPRSPDEDEAEG